MPAAFQSASSAACVPDLSPREMNAALLPLIAFSAATMSFVPLMPAVFALRPDQDEVVVHHRIALHAEAVGDEFLLLRPRVHEHHVGVAAPAGVERLAGALRDHAHVDAGLLLEQRQDVAEQAGVLGRGGGGDDDGFVLRRYRRCGEQRNGGQCKDCRSHDAPTFDPIQHECSPLHAAWRSIAAQAMHAPARKQQTVANGARREARRTGRRMQAGASATGLRHLDRSAAP